MIEVGNLFEDYNKDFLIDKILMDDPSHLNMQFMNLLKKFSNNSRIFGFYWNVLENIEAFGQEVINFVFESLSKHVKLASLKDKLEIINRCISLLNKNKAGIHIIKIIRSIFKEYKLTISKLYDL